MKKQFIVLAAALFVLAACHNEGSSTVGEKDKDYPNSFHKEGSTTSKDHAAPGGHTSPGSHTAPPDQTKVEAHADTTHTANDTTRH